MMLQQMMRAAAILGCVAITVPTWAQAPDTQRDLAMELLVAMRLDRQIERMTDQVAAQTAQFMQQTRPNMTAEEARVFGETYAAAIKMNVGDLVKEIANVYAREYSEGELKEIIAFYKSPTGQKYLDKAPELTARAAGLGQTWQQQNESSAQAIAAQEMKKRGFKDWQ